MEKEELVKKITDTVLNKLNTGSIDKSNPIDRKIVTGVSNRHIHLSSKHIEELFGAGYKLTPLKDLSQPGQYATKEVLTIVGSKLIALQNVRVLGPARETTQVELSKTDCINLGVDAPTRISGELSGSAPIVLVGPKGSVTLKEGAIRSERHIHMSPEDAEFFGISDKSYVDVRVSGPRGLTFNNVVVRVSPKFKTEFHVDTDDANTCDLENGSIVEIVDASCIVPVTRREILMADSDIIPPVIPDDSSYINIDAGKSTGNDNKTTDADEKSSSIYEKTEDIDAEGGKIPKREILTLSEVKEFINKGRQIDLNKDILTPLALDYLKEKNKF